MVEENGKRQKEAEGIKGGRNGRETEGEVNERDRRKEIGDGEGDR
jgi:hypothetical protein